MKIYVMTKADETVAILDNSLSGALHYFDDEFHRYLETGASTFDLSIAKKHTMYSNASKGTEDDLQYLKENHFLVFRYKDRDFKFTIRRVEETETSLRLFCEDLSFDLLNEYRGAYKADKAYPISKYVNDCLYDSGYEIGINEFTKNERTLEWEGDQTVLKRLLSICNSFSAEIEFETVLNDDRTVNKQLVHLRKQVGMDRPDIELKYGRDVSSIRRNVDVTELITGIKPRGHEEDNKIVTIKNVEKEIKDENGNVVFYTKKGSEYIYAPMANQEYGNPERKGGGYVGGQFSYDTKSDTELFNRALTELQKKCVPAYEFEIEGFYDIDIGDTIRAIDEGYNPILLLEARISEQTISFSDPTKNKTVYSNYRILQNKVSQSLLDRIDEVKKYAEQVAKTYIFSISNVGSPMFRNGEGEVIFTAKIEKNNQDMTGEFTKFNWIKQKKDGSLDTTWNEAHKNFGKALTITPNDFEDTATFSYEALQDDLIYGGASGVVTKVYDGENGKTPIKGVDYFDGKPGTNGLSAYLHVRYSQNANGNPMTSDPTNAVYLGLLVSQNPTASTVPADYDWSMVKGPQGIPGETVNGKTSYLHIKYSNDGGKTFTGNSGEDAGSYLGQYVDFESADSTDVKKYAWSRIEGETPVVHNAYAWSADGTDRFADTYPNENLLRGSFELTDEAFLNRGASTVESDTEGAVLSINKGSVSTNMALIPVVEGDIITISVDVKTKDEITSTNQLFLHQLYKEDTRVSYAWVSGRYSPSWTRFVSTVSIPANITAYSFGARAMYHNLDFRLIKIEKASSATIYTPSPLDDFENAYPTYSGTYTDYTAQDSQNPDDYVWTRILGNAGQDGNDGVGIASDPEITYQGSASGTNKPTGTWSTTIPEVPAGQFLWTKTVTTYTNNTNSTAYTVAKMGSDGKPGSTGVSVSAVVEEYYVSTSQTSQAGGSWSTTVPNNADPNKYIWRRLKTTMSNGTVTYTNPALIQGMTGIYPYIGPTQPANPKEGQQWWKSDSSGNVTNFYVYKSGSWQGQTIQQSVLNIIALNAVTITGSTITGTTISGSTLKSAGTMQSGGATIQYSTKISGTTEITWQIPGTTQNGVIKLQPDGIYANSWNNAAKTEPLWGWSIDSAGLWVGTRGKKSNTSLPNTTRYGPSGISISNEDYKALYGDVDLGYQDLITIPPTGIPSSTGWAQYNSIPSSPNYPSASRNGRTVQLAGAFKNNTARAAGEENITMGILPIGFRPASDCNFIVQGSGVNIYLLTVKSSGQLMFNRYRGDVGGTFAYKECPTGSWLNIACTYTAGLM
ncbi:phage tail protein [Enterococcus sp. MJM12]|uniref:Phage tail protein n=1 Tax=Candidatus Enterococcus myersii TaxID=2815322 RepID=A0ABS3H7E1_9ENTE|nr:phage tail spike protein [Enterococcus sp. MJM12]MBO0449362.1 phage tail protein [Enterococcus sp. MJM12]